MLERFPLRFSIAALVATSAVLGATARSARADDLPPPPPPPIPLGEEPDFGAPPAPIPLEDVTPVADVGAPVVPAGGPGEPVMGPPPAPPPAGPTAPGPVNPEAALPADPAMAPAALKELVGPVALYPDVVLSSLLPASTAPLDVVEAASFVKAQGGRVAAVPPNSTWEPAVQAMLQYPEALTKLAEDVGWLRRLGAAVEADQDAVLAAIQAFRADASKAGNLQSTPQMVVTTQPAPAADCDPVIVLEPASPSVVYVPVYDPVVVCAPSYRPWWSLYSWGIGTDCGPYGPWGWSYISWSYSWGWHHHHHHHHHDGYVRRHSGADVVGYSQHYGPAVIRRSHGVGYWSSIRTSPASSTTVFSPRSRSGATVVGGSSTYGPQAVRSGASRQGYARTGTLNGGGNFGGDGRTASTTYGPGTARTVRNAGSPSAPGATNAGTYNVGGTQFRRQGAPIGTTVAPRTTGTPTTVSTPQGTTQPRVFVPRRGGTTPTWTPSTNPNGFRTQAAPQGQPRTFTPQVQPRSYAPTTQPRSFTPSFTPSFQPRSNPSTSRFSPSTWFGGGSTAGRSFAPATPSFSTPSFSAPSASPRSFFSPRSGGGGTNVFRRRHHD